MLHRLHHIKRQAGWHGGNIALALCAGAMLVVGLGFMVAALWMLLAVQFSSLVATYVMGLFFLGLSGVLLLIKRLRRPPPVPSLDADLRATAARGQAYQPKGEFPALLEAFLFGVNTYVQVRNRNRRRPPPPPDRDA
ncbi:phage holin family protein [Roseinatronobacter sp. NSM]|uniref:phage holin family protein n=1 Tax=Roseinatronobacter sp. NSM TaxID=3457785 RepID=UPI0040365221